MMEFKLRHKFIMRTCDRSAPWIFGLALFSRPDRLTGRCVAVARAASVFA